MVIDICSGILYQKFRILILLVGISVRAGVTMLLGVGQLDVDSRDGSVAVWAFPVSGGRNSQVGELGYSSYGTRVTR